MSVPETQADEPTQTPSPAQSVPTSITPLDAEPFDIPSVPDLPRCPRCHYGLLYVIGADEKAAHENQPVTREGDPTSHGHFVPSGGSIRLMCFNCDTPQTQPMNADPEVVKAAQDAARLTQRVERAQEGAV